MKNIAIALSAAALAALWPVASRADLAFNAGVVTDYRYRGVSQTQLKPALQGGVDYSNGGFYLGAWGSTIKWVKKAGGDSNVELDLYGGYKTEISKGLGLDLGVLAYVYPSNKLGDVAGFEDADTQELYGALTYGPVTLKYSHALSNLFGVPDSKNSYYADLSASFEVHDGWSLAPHVGYQKVKSGISYADYSLTATKAFGALVPSIAIVGTDLKKSEATVDGKFLGKTSLVLGLKYSF